MKYRLIVASLLLISLACTFGRTPEAYNKPPSFDQSISDETAVWLLKQARAHLGGRSAEKQAVPQQATESRHTMVFITAYTEGRMLTARPVMGGAESLMAALNSALDRVSIPTKVRAASNRMAKAAGPDRIQIDIVDGDFVSLDGLITEPYVHLKLAVEELIDVGVDGIAMESGGRRFYLLPSEMIYNRLIEEETDEQRADDFLDRVMIHWGLGPGAWRSPQTKLSRFRTNSFVEDGSRSRALRLIRTSIFVDAIDRGRLLSAALRAGDYLVRMQQPDGSFHYLYDPLEDRFDPRAYNILRHAGAAYSLFELYAATREARYLDSARRAVRFLKSRLRPARAGRAVYLLDNDGKAKLGANGLALLALAKQIELDGRAADHKNAKLLAYHIIAMQNKDGSFESYYPLRGDEPRGSVSLYYPGEAILGLVSLYRLSNDKRLLDAARRGADYLIEAQRKMAKLPPDAWLMQGLEALYRIGREQKYGEHALALAEAMIAEQYTASDPPGFQGAFGPGLPRSTPAASRAEGLLAAYRIARAINDPRASRIADGLRFSVRFQLSQQFDMDNSFFLINPERAAGGFRAGITSMRIRIDYVQHNISSLLGIAQTLY